MNLRLISGSLSVPLPQPFSEIPPPFGRRVIARGVNTAQTRQNVTSIPSVRPEAAPTETEVRATAKKPRVLLFSTLAAAGTACLMGFFMYMRFSAQPAADVQADTFVAEAPLQAAAPEAWPEVQPAAPRPPAAVRLSPKPKKRRADAPVRTVPKQGSRNEAQQLKVQFHMPHSPLKNAAALGNPTTLPLKTGAPMNITMLSTDAN